MVHPDMTELTTQLAEVAARNAAGAVASKLQALQARKSDKSVVNDLIELVNDLIKDKNQLISIAQAMEQDLVAQRISDQEITYITTRLLPVAEQLAELAEGDDSNTAQALEAIKSLITPETLTIMQLVGFNFRKAIGEPLTMLVEQMILSRVPKPDRSEELQSLLIRQNTVYMEMLQIPEARQVFIDRESAAGA
jgi:hypothetical protein